MGTTYTSLSDPRFQRHFTEFRYTAFRLETLQVYDVSYERAEYRRFLSGEPNGPFPGIEEWARNVREATGRGKRFHRVHVLTEPLSDYARFECAWAYRRTVAAGEDVRILAVPAGTWPDDLTRQDFWLFDSRRLLRMDYAPDGTFRAAEVVDDPSAVIHANYQRDRAVCGSVPFTEYARKYDELMQLCPA